MVQPLRSASVLAIATLGACAPPGGVPDAALGDDAGSTDLDADTGSALPTQGQLTVLSLNLHCLKTGGTAYATNGARFAAIAAAVAALQIDVVLAQEVCISATEDARPLLRAALETATGATWSSVDARAHRAWEGTADEAEEHVAIFSRNALTSSSVTDHRVQGSLRRVTLGATTTSSLATASGARVPVRVYTVHLDHDVADARAAQAREVASVAMVETDAPLVALDAGAGAVALPVVVAGDFNARRTDPPPQALAELGFIEASGSAATTRIDHVFAHRSAPLVATSAMELFIGAEAVSDHPGVLVRFAPAAPTPVRLTRIVATGMYSSPLSLRGDHAPLLWDRGWPAIERAADVAFVTSELVPGTFAYKFLRNDVDWQLGANASGVGETDNVSTPSFP